MTFQTRVLQYLALVCLLLLFVSPNIVDAKISKDDRAEYHKLSLERHAARIAQREKIISRKKSPSTRQKKKSTTQFAKSHPIIWHNLQQPESLASPTAFYDADTATSPYLPPSSTQTKLSPKEQYIQTFQKLPKAQQEQLKVKQDELLALYRASDGYVSLSTRQYKQFAMGGARPYWLWITFTITDDDMYHCEPCRSFQPILNEITPVIYDQVVNTIHSEPREGEDPLPLIMTVVTPHSAPEVWQALQLRRAPVSTLLAPEFDETAFIPPAKLIDAGVFRQNMLMSPSRDDIINPLRTHAGFHVEIPPPPPPTALHIALLFLGLGVVFYLMYHSLPILYTLQQYRYPALLIVLAIYLYNVCGNMFVRIQKSPLQGIDTETGMKMTISRNLQDQFGIESIIFMCLVSSAAIGCIITVLSLYHQIPKASMLLTLPVDEYQPDTPSHLNIYNEPTYPLKKLSIASSTTLEVAFSSVLRFLDKQNITPPVALAVGAFILFFSFYITTNIFTLKFPGYPYSIGF